MVNTATGGYIAQDGARTWRRTSSVSRPARDTECCCVIWPPLVILTGRLAADEGQRDVGPALPTAWLPMPPREPVAKGTARRGAGMPKRQRVTRSAELPLDMLPAGLVSLRERAIAAGVPVSLIEWKGEPCLELEFPGSDGAIRIVSEAGAAEYEEVRFENFVQLGYYNALYNRETGTMEAGLMADVGSAGEFFREFFDTKEPAARNLLASVPSSWRLKVEGGESIRKWEVGSPTNDFQKLRWASGDQVTLKLVTEARSRETDQLVLLEKLSTAIFFEIDLKFGRLLGLQPSAQVRARRAYVTQGGRDPNELPEPRNLYTYQAARLYLIGRQQDILVAKYLAYYQAIEYFFPMIVESETITAVDIVLADPRFQRKDGSQAREVVAAVRRTKEETQTEEKQLRAAIKAAVSSEELRSFLSSPFRVEYFTAKQQALAGVQKLLLNPEAPDLIEHVARRVYTLRCRIVHSKSGLSIDVPGPLWPGTEESNSMWYDVELIEFLAQKVLIVWGRIV